MIHLNKKWRFISVMGLTLALMIASIFAGIWITHTHSAELGNALARCQSHSSQHLTAIIKNNTVTPNLTQAEICDTLTITNEDGKALTITLGKQGQELAYDGKSKRLLGTGQALTITLVQPGTFQFYDQNDLSVHGSFKVSGKLSPN